MQKLNLYCKLIFLDHRYLLCTLQIAEMSLCRNLAAVASRLFSSWKSAVLRVKAFKSAHLSFKCHFQTISENVGALFKSNVMMTTNKH